MVGVPTPLFFVSVAAEGVSSALSLLFATLARGSISVDSKEVAHTLSRSLHGEEFGQNWKQLDSEMNPRNREN
jgi:hypothetical protein